MCLGQGAKEVRGALFVVQQPFLAPDAAAVAAQRPVGADDAVAGDDDRQAVVAVGAAHGAGGAGAATSCAIREYDVVLPWGICCNRFQTLTWNDVPGMTRGTANRVSAPSK